MLCRVLRRTCLIVSSSGAVRDVGREHRWGVTPRVGGSLVSGRSGYEPRMPSGVTPN